MQPSDRSTVVLILGGVRSGKSRYAQSLAETSQHVTFIATAESRDDAEMRRKIDRHRAERPAHWTTVEEPVHLGSILQSLKWDRDVALVDCLTLFASNLLERHPADDSALQQNLDEFYTALEQPSCNIILVSNEVGSGVVPAYPLGRRFRDMVGEINQRVAVIADTVLLMVAGLPLPLKGTMPGRQP